LNRSQAELRKEAELKSHIPDSTPVPEEIEVLDVSSYHPRRIPPGTWRECIKKVWEVDPLHRFKLKKAIPYHLIFYLV